MDGRSPLVTPIGEAAFQALSARATPLTDDDLRALSPILVLSPHADDETLGCGGLIARAAALQASPTVAFLTDGGASHRGSPTWPTTRLVAARREEARAAVRALGGGEPIFLDWPDARPASAGGEVWRATLDQLGELSAGPRAVFAPWPFEAHCDHEAAAGLGAALAARLGARLFFFLVWGWSDPRVLSAENVRRLDCPETVAVRRRALACHVTQTTGLIDDAEDGFGIPEALAAVVERPAEIYLEA